jgi:hypothetical protein
MSTLGEILSDLSDPSAVIALLIEAGDSAAITGLNAAADASGRDPCDLAIDAVHAFTERADDEAWVKLVGRIQNAESPGAACLSEIISWSLAR